MHRRAVTSHVHQEANPALANPFTAHAAVMSAGDRMLARARIAVQCAAVDDGTVPMIKLGDASLASPFTSKKPSIQSTIDVIRQGRCTLVTTLQMYQILALNCLISSYSLSVLYLVCVCVCPVPTDGVQDGVKKGDRQMTCMGLLMSVSFISISNAKPLDKVLHRRSAAHDSCFIAAELRAAAH